ncbi:MAG: DNA polymerase III subunit beta [Gammaproteobacteria bacterium]|jgi:DNA polymerase III subunit beta
MQIKTNRETLLEPLLQINGVVERRQTLPILANVLIKCETDQIALTATDLEVELQTSMPAECSEEYELTLPARKLLDICKALPPNADIVVDIDSDRAILKSGRGRYSLGMLAASEYPVIESIDTQSQFTVSEQQLKQLIDKTAFAMAQQDVRYYLNGLLLEITSDRLRAVATDGHRLALSDTRADLSEIEERKVILPRKAVLELGRLLSESDNEVLVSLSKNHARFQRGNTLFTSKLIDGRFPDYERVIPASGGSVLEAQRDELKAALQRASILSNEKYRGIRFTFGENALTLVANNPEQEEAEETVDVTYTGDAMSIGFNVGYVLDVLNVIETETVLLTVTDPNSSAIMTNKGQDDNRYVIMPMRL